LTDAFGVGFGVGLGVGRCAKLAAAMIKIIAGMKAFITLVDSNG
jgi:hypothetical protein